MNREKDSTLEYDNSNVYGIVKEDFPKQPFKNPDNALRDAMNFLAQEDWYLQIPFQIYFILLFYRFIIPKLGEEMSSHEHHSSFEPLS